MRKKQEKNYSNGNLGDEFASRTGVGVDELWCASVCISECGNPAYNR